MSTKKTHKKPFYRGDKWKKNDNHGTCCFCSRLSLSYLIGRFQVLNGAEHVCALNPSVELITQRDITTAKKCSIKQRLLHRSILKLPLMMPGLKTPTKIYGEFPRYHGYSRIGLALPRNRWQFPEVRLHTYWDMLIVLRHFSHIHTDSAAAVQQE